MSTLQNGDFVTDGRGNTGQVFRFWNDQMRRYYVRVRVIEGPLRQAGQMWTSPDGWSEDLARVQKKGA